MTRPRGPTNRHRRPSAPLRTLRRSEPAVAGVIAATMVVALLGIIIASMYAISVPVWLKNTENHHMRQVGTDFTRMRNGLQEQVTNGNSFSVGHTITLRADPAESWMGVTGHVVGGVVGLDTSGESQEIIAGATPADVYAAAKGAIFFTSRNQQYPAVQYVYENGAIIRWQDNGDNGTMFSAPPIDLFNDTSGRRTLVYPAYSLLGDPGTFTGPKSTVVLTTVRVSVVGEFSNVPDFDAGKQINITITSDFPQVWEEFFRRYLQEEAALIPAVDFNVTRSGSTVVASIEGVNRLQLSSAVIDVDI